VRFCGTGCTKSTDKNIWYENVNVHEEKLNQIKSALSQMTSLEKFIAPVGEISLVENLCKQKLKCLGFSRGN
jgi:hypothetical protein